MFNKRSTKKFAKTFHIFLEAMEFSLKIALDAEYPIEMSKIDEALNIIESLKKTLSANHKLPHKTILHFLELLTKNLLLAKAKKPASPLKEEFALMHKLAEYLSL